jgi:aspartyl protease family protein
MRRQHDPAQPPYRLGRGMMLFAWAAGLGLLSLLFSGILEQQRNPNTRLDTMLAADGSREIQLQRNHYGHYLASGSINGQPVEFLLDTGASDVSIPEAVARRLGLERGNPRLYKTANGTITAYATRLDRLALGGIELRQVRASINPQMGDETILLGMSVLRQLEFTQRGDTLIIRQ